MATYCEHSNAPVEYALEEEERKEAAWQYSDKKALLTECQMQVG